MGSTNGQTNAEELLEGNSATAFTNAVSISPPKADKLFKDTGLGSVVFVLLPVLLTLLIGYGFFGWLSRRRDQRAKNIDAIIARCEDLRKFCIQYWSTSVNKNCLAAARVSEQQIKSMLKAIKADIRSFSERHEKSASEALGDNVVELNDACTGGDFEMSKRQPDKTRCEMVGKEIDRLNAALQNLKK